MHGFEFGGGRPFERRRGMHVKRRFQWVVERLEARTLLSVDVWKAAISGDWGVASNWSLGRVPTAGDDAQINVPGAYTVTHSGGVDVAHSLVISQPLVLTAGTLVVQSTLQVNASALSFVMGRAKPVLPHIR